MNLLQDKKKLPVVISVVVVVLLAAVGAMLYEFGVFTPQPQQADNTVPATTAAPGTPPGVPGAPGMPPGMRPGAPGMPPGAPGMPPVPAVAGVNRKPGAKIAAGKPGNPALAAKAAQAAKKAALAKAKGTAPTVAKVPGVPGTPGVPGAPGAAGANTPATKLASTKPDPATVPDPFKLPKVDTGRRLVRRNTLPGVPPIPSPLLSNWRPHTVAPRLPESPIVGPQVSSAGRRMAGVLFGDGVYAILETNGKTEAVQPGDTVEGGKVVSIEADGLTIKTDDDRLIKVPLSSTPTGGEESGPQFGGPGGYPGFGMPGATGGYPGYR